MEGVVSVLDSAAVGLEFPPQARQPIAKARGESERPLCGRGPDSEPERGGGRGRGGVGRPSSRTAGERERGAARCCLASCANVAEMVVDHPQRGPLPFCRFHGERAADLDGATVQEEAT